MKPIYFLLKIFLSYAMRVFYPRVKLVNAPKQLFGRTIYVSNHAASFMDPIATAALSWPIVFFMTRSDIFTKYTRRFMYACHMLPIYRQHDGEDTKSKNEEVFQRCAKILKGGRNLLIFGEGFTDDVFIRRLKPVKKGAVRIGFQTLEESNWDQKIYICALGVNYSDPARMRSDFLLSYSDKICLNDYKDTFLENPSKVIHELSTRIEILMREQITHVENKDLAPFHENIMIITRKGMNLDSHDRKLSLFERWKYSRQLALWMNEQDVENSPKLVELKEKLSAYFGQLKRSKLLDRHVYWKQQNGNRMKELLLITVLFPFSILGFVHTALPYYLTKRFTEKSFKRPVFWSSVKLIVGMLLIAIFNIPTIFIFYYVVYPSWWLAIAYFFTIGLTGLAAYMIILYIKEFNIKGKIKKMDTRELIQERRELVTMIHSEIPVA